MHRRRLTRVMKTEGQIWQKQGEIAYLSCLHMLLTSRSRRMLEILEISKRRENKKVKGNKGGGKRFEEHEITEVEGKAEEGG